MAAIDSSSNDLITHPKLEGIVNPEVSRIAQDVLSAARLSFAATIAKPDGSVSSTTAEASLVVVMKQLAPEVSAAAQARAAALLNADSAAKEVVFGRFSGTSTEGVRGAGFQKLVESAQPLAVNLAKLGINVPSGSPQKANTAPQTALKASSPEMLIDTANFARLWGDTLPAPSVKAGVDPTDPATPSLLPAKMKIWLRLLRCDDETNPEGLGDDEMAVAGVSINEKGDTQQIAERSAGGGYHDGVEHSLNWSYYEFDLAASNQWPKRFGATLILAEKDHGGLSDYLQKLWDATSKAIHAALEKAALAAGVALGTFLGLPQYGPVIGQALALAAKWVVDNVVRWLIDMFKDDVFTPATVWVNVPSLAARWNFPNGQWGSTLSPVMNEAYIGFGGQYRLDYQWERTSEGVIQWSGWQGMTGGLSQITVARNRDGRLEAFGVGGNNEPYHNWQTTPGGSWSGWQGMTGGLSQITVAENADGRLEAFGIGGNNEPYHNWQTTPGGSWSGWQGMTGRLTQVTVARNRDGRLEAFGIAPGNEPYHNWQTTPGGSWSGWQGMTGRLTQVTVARNRDGRLEAFGIAPGNEPYHNWQTTPGGSWSGWQGMTGGLSQITVAENADGRLEAFGIGGNNEPYHNWQTTPGGSWSGWQGMTGGLSQITVARNRDGRLEAFGIGGNNEPYHNWQTTPGGSWSGWQGMTGGLSQITVAENADGRLEAFGIGGNNEPYHNWQKP